MKSKKYFFMVFAVCALCLPGCTARGTANAVDQTARRQPLSYQQPALANAENVTNVTSAANALPKTNAILAREAFVVPEDLNIAFSTSYKGGHKGRVHNIRHAAATIDGTVLQPGETFSYNNALGPTTKANGYKKARIFVRGKDAEGYGGGVCQVSSTLYNAAEIAGLEIIERHPHSKPVAYVEEGRDAATSYGGIDLRFQNTKDYAIRITAETDAEKVIVRITAAGVALG